MIIVGTKSKTKTLSKGTFYCPDCQGDRDYKHQRVKLYSSAYFIPIFPIKTLGEYIECQTCKNTYKPAVLDYNPDDAGGLFEAEFNAAMKKAMIHVLLADGKLEESELEAIESTYHKLADQTLTRETLLNDIEQVKNSNNDLSETLTDLQGCLNEPSKKLVLTAAYLVALADLDFQDSEKQLLESIGKDLGMSAEEIDEVLNK